MKRKTVYIVLFRDGDAGPWKGLSIHDTKAEANKKALTETWLHQTKVLKVFGYEAKQYF